MKRFLKVILSSVVLVVVVYACVVNLGRNNSVDYKGTPEVDLSGPSIDVIVEDRDTFQIVVDSTRRIKKDTLKHE